MRATAVVVAGLLMLQQQPSSADDSLVTPLHDNGGFEHFVRRHKPLLNKVVFFTEQGTSTLCKKLAAEFEGRLAFGILAERATELVEKFQVFEFPSLRVIVSRPGKPGQLLQGTADVSIVKVRIACCSVEFCASLP